MEGNKLAGIVRYVSAKEQGRVSSLVFRKRCNCDQKTCMRYKLWYAILFWVGRGEPKEQNLSHAKDISVDLWSAVLDSYNNRVQPLLFIEHVWYCLIFSITPCAWRLRRECKRCLSYGLINYFTRPYESKTLIANLQAERNSKPTEKDRLLEIILNEPRRKNNWKYSRRGLARDERDTSSRCEHLV